jgi:uncharacterized protein YggL (DUF469 family)
MSKLTKSEFMELVFLVTEKIHSFAAEDYDYFVERFEHIENLISILGKLEEVR